MNVMQRSALLLQVTRAIQTKIPQYDIAFANACAVFSQVKQAKPTAGIQGVSETGAIELNDAESVALAELVKKTVAECLDASTVNASLSAAIGEWLAKRKTAPAPVAASRHRPGATATATARRGFTGPSQLDMLSGRNDFERALSYVESHGAAGLALETRCDLARAALPGLRKTPYGGAK